MSIASRHLRPWQVSECRLHGILPLLSSKAWVKELYMTRAIHTTRQRKWKSKRGVSCKSEDAEKDMLVQKFEKLGGLEANETTSGANNEGLPSDQKGEKGRGQKRGKV
ncbi:hypothetical protein J3459_006785 [Metarhizium acridum]|uniref:uncharacterized protein n=1 Tax=Metarhizium acridum TaxID=92637 RepID=UPI001C6BE9F5|nr:hypothetical protein J3458_019166 [Metarhizium acridum]KAG8427316.1 hypothetical protein J3459_006785 [Metarhizium acridum]